MTEEERERVEAHLWVVEFVLRQFHAERDDELRSEGYLALCGASPRYDQSKGNFSTYAVGAVRFRFLAVLKKRREAERRTVELVRDDCVEYTEDMTENLANKVTVDNILRRLSDFDRQIVILKARGYTDEKIAEQIGSTRKTVSRHINAIRKEMRENADI